MLAAGVAAFSEVFDADDSELDDEPDDVVADDSEPDDDVAAPEVGEAAPSEPLFFFFASRLSVR